MNEEYTLLLISPIFIYLFYLFNELYPPTALFVASQGGEISSYIRSNNQVADLLTKTFTTDMFKRLRNMIYINPEH